MMHTGTHHDSSSSTYHTGQSHHSDIAFSATCSKEQRTTRFDQERTLKVLDGILYSKVEDLPQSRVFHLVSYDPPLIEDAITASLTTVVRILYN
ncbi:hypothetical protein [Fodinibius salsisoli]|uniref:Uncharacterized protein n=1 Tax=Fodinibius salsisoli TaxID=2820877 RepID=A0ABT3PK17_9BACT|nr:hypothetical protein [Fodinibius salsisoli]MCW9706271.1 hypothetical protein [Fodinibius salsisoli]